MNAAQSKSQLRRFIAQSDVTVIDKNTVEIAGIHYRRVDLPPEGMVEPNGVLALLDGNTPEGRLTFVVDDDDLPMMTGFYRLVPEQGDEREKLLGEGQ